MDGYVIYLDCVTVKKRRLTHEYGHSNIKDQSQPEVNKLSPANDVDRVGHQDQTTNFLPSRALKSYHRDKYEVLTAGTQQVEAGDNNDVF
jgi:hypothetical protein